MREPTAAEKYAFVGAVVDTAITQAAECSGLRAWLIWQTAENFADWHDPNAAEIMLDGVGSNLIQSFETMIDPDDDPPDFGSSSVEYQEPEMPWLEEKQHEPSI